MKKNCERFLRALLLLILVLCLALVEMPPAAAVTQADIDALKDDAKGLAQEKKDIQAQLDKLFFFGSDRLKGLQIVNNPLIIFHDLINHIQPAQKV